MIQKTITLKFADGRRETATVLADSEREFATKIDALMAARNAVGFGTQATVRFRSLP